MANGSSSTEQGWLSQVFGPILGLTFIAGSFVVFWLVLTGKTAIEWKDIAQLIVGSLLATDGVIIAKYYISSQSSERKTEIMAAAAKTAAVTATDTAKVLAATEAAEEK